MNDKKINEKKINKKNLIMLSSATVISFVSIIIALAALSIKSLGTFDSSWSTSSHNIIIAFRIIILIMSIIVMVISGILVYKTFRKNEPLIATKLAYAMIAISVVIIIFGIVAIVLNM